MVNGEVELQTDTTWKVPVQERSRRRFDEILDAAGAELDDVGWYRFAMESVARRANGSIGSVYRYFPNKLSLIAALIDSQYEQLRRVYHCRTDDESSFEDAVQAMIDEYGAVVRQIPGLKALGTAAMVDNDAHVLFRRALGPVSEWMADAIRQRLPKIETTRLVYVSEILTHSIESLLFLSNRPDFPNREAVLRETRLILRGYINELKQELGGH